MTVALDRLSSVAWNDAQISFPLRGGTKWASMHLDGIKRPGGIGSHSGKQIARDPDWQPVENQILLSRKANWTITSHKDDRCAFACHLQTAARVREWPQLHCR